MSETDKTTDQRHISRDSLFVLAGLRVAGHDREHKVKVRNLSPGGLMAEGTLRVARGMGVSVEVRNIGWVAGTVAWVQENRFGIAFDSEIDPLGARGATTSDGLPADFQARKPTPVLSQLLQNDPGRLRKI